MSSLDEDHLRLRSKTHATLGLMRKHDPCRGHGADHHGIASVGANCIVAGEIKIAGEGIKKSLDQIIPMLSTIMSNPPGATFIPFHLNFSSDRAFNGSDDQKTYQDSGVNFHRTLKKNQGAF